MKNHQADLFGDSILYCPRKPKEFSEKASSLEREKARYDESCEYKEAIARVKGEYQEFFRSKR